MAHPSTTRPRQAHLRGRFVFPLAALLTAALPAACDHGSAATAAPGPTHTVRAKVIALPKAGDPSSSFTLAHEEIPTWARPDGGKGMHAMEMPFPVAQGVALDGIAPGDKVEISVRQYTGGSIPYEVIAIKKLPADTALKLAE